MQRTLILASASPRRRELLNLMGIPHSVDVADVDETFSLEEPQPCLLLAKRKAQAVAWRHPDALVLGADTIVYKGNEPLGKPRDAADAARMLQMLSDGWHEVHTGMCLMDRATGRECCRMEAVRVHMLPLDEAEITAYIHTGEPMDKAGAYAIQGRGGMYIDRIEGAFSTVVGLPTSAVWQALKDFEFFK